MGCSSISIILFFHSFFFQLNAWQTSQKTSGLTLTFFLLWCPKLQVINPQDLIERELEMSSITGRPSRYNRKITAEDLRRCRNQWWDAHSSQSSRFSTLSSFRLMPGEQVKKLTRVPQAFRLSSLPPRVKKWHRRRCCCQHPTSPFPYFFNNLPNRLSSSNPIAIPDMTGNKNRRWQ